MNDQVNIQLIAFSPDLSHVTFLLKDEDKIGENPAKYAFLDYPVSQNTELVENGLPKLEWNEENEESILSKRDFFEFNNPIVGKSLKDTVDFAKEVWQKFENNETLKEYRKNISEGKKVEVEVFEQITNELVSIGLKAPDEIFAFKNRNKEK